VDLLFSTPRPHPRPELTSARIRTLGDRIPIGRLINSVRRCGSSRIGAYYGNSSDRYITSDAFGARPDAERLDLREPVE
jgi:hypothetical protein